MSDKARKSYKDTLNLPQTDFDMRAGLLAKEPQIQARWAKEDLYGRIRAARARGHKYILHDGPPYANGDIHIGHALNKVLKDLVVRYKTMTGFDAPYIPGWDCHGLPIESKVQSEVGEGLVKMPHPEIRRRCAAYADKYVTLQSQQFQRLGCIGDWAHPYITMAPQYEAGVLEVLAGLVEQGLVFKQLKPVHWSIDNRTALAEAELEYKDRSDDSIFVLLHVHQEATLREVFGFADAVPLFLMVWTTTPWTLPANLAVAVHPDFEYSAVRFNWHGRDVIAVLASQLAEQVLRAGGVAEHKVLGTVRGAALVNAKASYCHPLIERKACPVVAADYVTLEDGTGLVHTAPGHGLEDYGTGLRCGLDIYCPVQGDGTFDSTAPAWLMDKSVWQANPLVVEFLQKAGTLFRRTTITHSYPHDWRSKTPTIFRATEQWFVGVDRPMKRGTTLRQMAMDACRSGSEDGGIDFVPAWGQNRLAGMLESRPDWCISRQRSWGLPIPAFYEPAGRVLLTPASVRAVARHFAANGSDSWFIDPPAVILGDYDPAKDPDWKNDPPLDLKRLSVGLDILDVWFESGSSWYSVAMQRGLVKDVPVDMYLEGSDQHRGWFQLSLLPALGCRGVPPFKTLLTHGFVMDETGRAMHKSEGNYIAVMDQLGKRGADILRLWAAGQDYQEDVNCGEHLIAQTEDAYRKIRNTLRYALGACFDFDPAVNSVPPADHSLDCWMRLQLHELIRNVRAAYESFEFYKATRLMYEFCTVQASSVYMAAIKDRLYCDLPDSPRRRATQTVLRELLMALVKLLAPILPHTCEEAWGHIPHRDKAEPDTVHLSLMPEVDAEALALAEGVGGEGVFSRCRFEIDTLSPSAVMVWQRLMDLRQEGLAKLEALRNAGVKNSLDAEAVFLVRENDPGSQAFVQMYLAELEDFLGVGYARLETVSDGQAVDPSLTPQNPIGVRVDDTRAKYKSCARSWKRRPDVGSDPEYPDLSARDAAVVRSLSK